MNSPRPSAANTLPADGLAGPLVGRAWVPGKVGGPSPVVLLAFCFAASGFVTVQPLLWIFPTAYMGGVAATGGIATIGALGNVGGFVAPMLKAHVESWLGIPQAGMLSLSAAGLVGVCLLWGLYDLQNRPEAAGQGNPELAQ